MVLVVVVVITVVEATSAYTPASNLENGYECGQPAAGCVNGRFAQINVATDSSVDIKVSFQDTVTQDPVTLGKFLFSVHDVDGFQSGKIQERVLITGFSDNALVDPSSEVAVATEADGRTSITSTQDGTLCDDPTNPMQLTDVVCSGVTVDQRKRSAAFVFENTDAIYMTLQVTCLGCTPTGSGRSFLFTGDTNLVTCENLTK